MLTLHGVPVYVSGVAGHFTCSDRCVLRMHWRIGDYRVSTVGGYVQDRDDTKFAAVGSTSEGPAYSETMVFALRDDGTEEGEPVSWGSELYCVRCTSSDTRKAEQQHYVIAGAVARAFGSGRYDPRPEDIVDAIAQERRPGAHG